MSEYLGLYDSAATFANVECIQNFGDEPAEKLRFLRRKRLEDNIKMGFSEVDRGNGNFITVRVRAKRYWLASQPTNQLNINYRGKIFLEKLRVSQLTKKFPVFIVTGRFITMFTRAPNFSLPSARRTPTRDWNFGHDPFSQTKTQFTDSWIKRDQLDVTCFYISLFNANMFRMLIHQSSGACDLFVELFHGLYCPGCIAVVSGCRLKH